MIHYSRHVVVKCHQNYHHQLTLKIVGDVPLLNVRSKWYKREYYLKVGDLVLAISTEQPRGHWLLPRIIDIFPGKDAHVRAARVQVGNTTRPITKLAPLEVQ